MIYLKSVSYVETVCHRLGGLTVFAITVMAELRAGMFPSNFSFLFSYAPPYLSSHVGGLRDRSAHNGQPKNLFNVWSDWLLNHGVKLAHVSIKACSNFSKWMRSKVTTSGDWSLNVGQNDQYLGKLCDFVHLCIFEEHSARSLFTCCHRMYVGKTPGIRGKMKLCLARKLLYVADVWIHH